MADMISLPDSSNNNTMKRNSMFGKSLDAVGNKFSSSWVKCRLLGSGSYGAVYLATSKNNEDKTKVAIKSADISQASTLVNEQRILTRLSSPFVLRCFGHEIVYENTLSPTYNLILEYCPGKSIADLLERGRLPENVVKVFVRDIVLGLYHIHSNNVIHCDIKPDNVLLARHRTRSIGFSAKIADFGLSMEKGCGNEMGHRRGTKRYMAPELLTHGIVDYPVDVWALGCTVLEMLTGESAWGEHTGLGSLEWLDLVGRRGFIPNIPDWLSVEAHDFLRVCLVKDPGSRWGIGDLMYHSFFCL